jgi:cytochrome c5
MNVHSKTFIAALSFITFSAIPGISIATNADDIQNRVQKVGKLNISEAAAPADMSGDSASDAAGAAADPAALYQASCFACHGTGAAGAPILGDKDAWAPRIAQGEATVLEHAINGLNAMPPRGGSSLSDEEIEAIVEHMISSSQ